MKVLKKNITDVKIPVFKTEHKTEYLTLPLSHNTQVILHLKMFKEVKQLISVQSVSYTHLTLPTKIGV